MKKYFIVTTLLLLFATQTAHACSMIPPYIQINIGEKKCNLNSGWNDFEKINLEDKEEECSEAGIILSHEDKKNIDDLYSSLLYRQDLANSYIHIEKQSDQEYQLFIDENSKINSQICNCSKVTEHGREGDWTSYTSGYKDTCSFSPACYQPPLYCLNNTLTKHTYPYLVGLFIVSGIAIFFIKKRRKK